MKKHIFVFVFLFSSIGVAKASIAGLFVEPMLTYETGSGNISFPAPINNSDSKVKGFGVGARLGAQVFDIVFAGVDGRYSIPKLKDTTLNQVSNQKDGTQDRWSDYKCQLLLD